ncbi:MAG: hypothetical protein WBA76_19140 [Phormidesmis sp.]
MTKQLSNRPLLTRMAKIGGAVAFSLFTLSLTACQPEVTESNTEADIPSDQTAVPPSAEVDTGANAGTATTDAIKADADTDLSTLMGQSVTVSTKVTEDLSPNLFTVYDKESMRGEEVLVFTESTPPAVGTNIELTGIVEKMDPATIKSAYNVDIDPKLVQAYEGKPYIAAQAMEPVD